MLAKHRWKTNQDEVIINLNLMNLPHMHFIAVCDGHGSNGHIIAKFIKEHLPAEIIKNMHKFIIGTLHDNEDKQNAIN